MKKIWPLVAGVAALCLVLGFAGGYWMMPEKTETQTVYKYKEAPDEGVRAVDLTASLNTTTFDFTSAVDTNGSVTTKTTVNKTLTITNNDEKAATDVMIAMEGPVTGTDGLSDYLEVAATEVYVVGDTMSNAIYYNGGYIKNTDTDPTTYGYEIGDIAPGGSAEVTFRITLDSCVDGTYQDGQTYSDQSLYVYQPNANFQNTVAFTVTT